MNILLGVLEEELEIHLKHSLEQPHICALVQTDLVLPDIHNEDLARRKSEQGTLPLEILVLATLATVGPLDVHDENVIGHLYLGVAGSASLPLILREPYALGGLPPLGLGHYGELGAEQVVEEGRLAGRLRSEDGNEVVVESSIGNIGLAEVGYQVGAANKVVATLLRLFLYYPTALVTSAAREGTEGGLGDASHVLEGLVFVYDLDSMLVLFGAWPFANGGKMAVHGC